jgi:hypothetical protein
LLDRRSTSNNINGNALDLSVVSDENLIYGEAKKKMSSSKDMQILQMFLVSEGHLFLISKNNRKES